MLEINFVNLATKNLTDSWILFFLTSATQESVQCGVFLHIKTREIRIVTETNSEKI